MAIVPPTPARGISCGACRSAAISRSFQGWCSTAESSTANGLLRQQPRRGSRNRSCNRQGAVAHPRALPRRDRARCVAAVRLGGVYVTGGGASATAGGMIVAIDVADGEVRWTERSRASPVRASFSIRPFFAVSTVPPGRRRNHQALDRATGYVLWTGELPAGAEAWSTIAADNSRIFATYSGNDGDYPPSRSPPTPARPPGNTKAARPDQAARAGRSSALETATGLVRFDSDTGEQRWRRTGLVDMGDRVDTADGRVVMAGPTTVDHVVDLASGKDAWSHRVGDVVVTRTNGIVLSDGNRGAVRPCTTPPPARASAPGSTPPGSGPSDSAHANRPGRAADPGPRMPGPGLIRYSTQHRPR